MVWRRTRVPDGILRATLCGRLGGVADACSCLKRRGAFHMRARLAARRASLELGLWPGLSGIIVRQRFAALVSQWSHGWQPTPTLRCSRPAKQSARRHYQQQPAASHKPRLCLWLQRATTISEILSCLWISSVYLAARQPRRTSTTHRRTTAMANSDATKDASLSASASETPSPTVAEDTPSQSSAADAATSPSPAPTPQPASAATEQPVPPTLEQARLFLRDDTVRKEARSRKVAFLAGKGLSQDQIDGLLAEEEESETGDTNETPAAASTHPAEQAPSLPPIVTYPEFIVRAPQPPPLVTPNVFLGALYGGAAASSLFYATARYVLAPMVDALTASRTDLNQTAAANLARLLDRLEAVVSEVPAAAKAGADGAAVRAASAANAAAAAEDDVSTAGTTDSYDDPTEVFHRDIGVQTSLPASPTLAPTVTMDSTVPTLFGGAGAGVGAGLASEAPPASLSTVQAERLAQLVDSVRSMSQAWVGPTDVLAEIQTTLGVFREDVDKLTRPPAYAFMGAYGNAGIYGGASTSAFAGSNSAGAGASGGGSSSKYNGYVATTRNEPDDEIRKAKENIRRVKGALLTARTFPTAR